MIQILAIALAATLASDVSALVDFSDPAACVASTGTERILSGMEGMREAGSVVATLPGGVPLVARMTRSAYRGDGTRTDVEARFPRGTTWRGLRIRAIRTVEILPSESDSYHAREFAFDASPADVRRAFAEIGARIPPAPGYLAVEGGDDEPPASMSIKSDGRGAKLVCDRGH